MEMQDTGVQNAEFRSPLTRTKGWLIPIVAGLLLSYAAYRGAECYLDHLGAEFGKSIVKSLPYGHGF